MCIVNYPEDVIRGWRSGGSALVLLALVLAACGGGSSTGDGAGDRPLRPRSSSSSPGTTVARKPGQLSGPLLVSPPTVAPQIVLHDQDGKLFKLSSLRGKAVFLTFVYCALPRCLPADDAGARRRRKRWLPDPSIMQIIAVSVDPKGDTPKVVKEFLRSAQLTGKARWLLGTRDQLRSGLDRVQHRRQVGARDARDHRARLADLRHRRPRPHPRRLSGVADQARRAWRTTLASSRARSDHSVKAAVRREAPAVAAVIVAVRGGAGAADARRPARVLGRHSTRSTRRSRAFLHDRLAAGDLPVLGARVRSRASRSWPTRSRA